MNTNSIEETAEWKYIDEYEKYYMISSTGKVYGIMRQELRNEAKKLLKPKTVQPQQEQ